MKYPALIIGLALTFSLGAGCASPQKIAPEPAAMPLSANTAPVPGTNVCALLYSGRPDNICWQLTDFEELELTTKIQLLEDTTWQKQIIPLGYHGLNAALQQNMPLGEGGFPVSINVFDGILSYNKDGKAMIDSRSYIDKPNPHLAYKSDPGRSVEKWLLDTGKDEIPQDIYALISQTFEKQP